MKRIATFHAADGFLLTGRAARKAWASQSVRCACGTYGDEDYAIDGTCRDMPARWLGCDNCRGRALGYPLVFQLPSQMEEKL